MEIFHREGSDPKTGPSSFDPFARGASTTGNYYSVDINLMEGTSEYEIARLPTSG